ncbi:MAG TPA: saccharopine dehydrogenase C-terminal domain-containing protein [Phycisphaerales bacterium]|nr:saccharopine dehydrogenase C-terminal domain-containing protein [Phycisphaerales bacterium]
MAASSVLVLGTGKVGKTVAEMLLSFGKGNYRVTLGDASESSLAEASQNLSNLSAWVKSNTKGKSAFGVDFDSRRVDCSSSTDIAAALKGHDYVICMLPHQFVRGIAEAANKAGVHYFDVTEDVKTTDRVRAIAKARPRIALAPQCGLAPGYIAIAAHDVSRDFDTVQNLTLRVGALPMFPTNRLKYNITWSTDGVINEYCEPCNVMLDGKMVKVPALEGLEHFSLSGVEYEAFYTSGGVGSLIETLQAGKRLSPTANVAYKTLRYPGHCELMKFLLQDMRFSEKAPSGKKGDTGGDPLVNRDTLVQVFNKSVPRTLQDVVVVFVNCIGTKNGKPWQKNFQRIVPATQLFGRIWPAIELTTASGVCAMVDLHRTGGLKKTGFIAQESVSLDMFSSSIFGLAYDNPGVIEAAVVGGR